MNAGKTLVGAVVGAAVGFGAHVALEYLAKGEAPWFAVVTGVLTGLGVRKFDLSVANTASYLRGAVAALVALGGIFGGIQGASLLAQNSAKQASAETGDELRSIVEKEDADAAAAADGDDPEQGDDDQPTEEADSPAVAPLLSAGDDAPPKDPIVSGKAFSYWDFILIGLGVFLAYELARGNSPAENGQEEETQAPADPPADEQPGAEQPENPNEG